MKILKFKYTKSPKDVSDRVFVPITEPSQLYFGLDISELDKEAQAKAINRLARVMNSCKEYIDLTIMELGLEKSYRNFTQSKMSEIDINFEGNTCPEPIVEKAMSQKDS